MSFKSFLLGNLVSLCMKIINSVVVVGLYYGFLTTFSIWHSYLFLLRAQVMEERDEGTEKISATTGFITGQLIMFISIYYAPLHLALGKPHTITVLVLPYLLYNFFFWNNQKHFFDYGSITRKNSMHNFSIQFIFLNNLILQLFNYLILPSSILARLVNIYMFRYNTMLFVTSSFLGWLMGHILFMKWVGLVLVFWIRLNHSIRWNLVRKIPSNQYLVSELRNYMARILSILLFITCVYFLVRVPSPILTNKLKDTSEIEEKGDSEEEEETDVEIEKSSGTKDGQQEISTEDPSPSLYSEEKGDTEKFDETKERRGNEKIKNELYVKATCYKKDPVSETHYLDANPKKLTLEIFNKKDKKNFVWFWFEQPLVILLFDYKKQWNRPLRYIKNDQFENAVRNEISQYFFYTCPSDGKRKISFTYPSSLLTFLEMIQRKIDLSAENLSSNELYNYWIDTNEQKKNKQSNEFLKRIEALDKKYFFTNILEKRTRLCCNNETKNKKYLPKIYDPFVKGSYRGTTKILYSPSIINESFIEYHSIKIETVETVCINKIHDIFLTYSREFKHQKIDNKFDKRSLSTKKICKKVPQWSYKLIDELEQQEGENENLVAEDHEIRSRKAKRVILFTNDYQNSYTYDSYTEETLDPDQADEVALIRYPQQSDFRRYIIKCSMRIQRRKTGIWELFQANTHSPLFLDRRNKLFFHYFEISNLMKFIFRNGMVKFSKFKISNFKEQERKEERGKNEEDNKRKDKMRIEIAEAWDTILFAQLIRGCMLLIQSILRKYMILPLLIIVKNISRILLFQIPEWSDDLKEWKREMHVKCTYNGVQLSENEFPKNWSTEGIQIKILFPFRLKPWHRSKIRSLQKDPMLKKKKIFFSFLTVWGMESEIPFGSPRKQPSFFEPIFKKLKKKIIKLKNNFFLVLRILKEKKGFLRISKKTKKWVIKKFLLFFLLKRTIKNISKVKIIIIFLLGLKEDELSQTKKEKYSIINNRMINELSIQKGFMDWTKDSMTEEKINNLNDRRNTIRNQIERLKKDNKKKFLTPGIQMSSKKISSKPKIKLELPKNILKILKARLIMKSYFFIKNFIEKIYDILLCIIRNIPSLNTQISLELTKKKLDNKHTYSEVKQDRIYKTNQTTIHLISNLKKSLYYISNRNNSKNSSHIFCDLSLSQTYVFYKLSKIKIKNLYKFRDVLQYHGTSFFLKNEKKDCFGIKGIHLDSKLRHKKLWKSEMKQWKNWFLRGHYQYDLSPIRWSRLISQKWQNTVNQHGTVQNRNLNKWDFYKRVQFIYYKKKTDSYEEILLSNKKYHLKKDYRYDKRSYHTINYEYRNASYIYGSPLHVKLQVKKKNKERIDYYNYKTHKQKLLDLLGPIHNYLGEDGIRDIEKNMKVWWNFDCRIPHFCLNKLYIGTLMDVDTGTNSNQNMKTGTKNYQIIDQMDKNQKDLLYHLTIHQKIEPFNKKKIFLNWMGMNEEILNSPRSNTGLWFFPELVLLCNKYKIKQWFIPIKLLLLNFSEDIWENKNINAKQKNILISSKEKYFELENQNKELTGLGNIGSDLQNQDNLEYILSNQQNFIEEDYESNFTKRRKKKQYKSHTETELDFFLKRSFIFQQLRWNDSLNQKIINNIKVYCLLLRQRNPKEMALSSIQRGEFCLDLMLNQKFFTLTELIKTGILIIEPVRRSVKNDIQFIMYQTVGISLVHKSKYQTNQRYQEKSIVNKKFKKSIERQQKIFGKKDENDYYVFFPENLLSAKRCREFRIRIEINSKNRKNMNNKNPKILNQNNVKNCSPFSDENEHFDNIIDKKLIKIKSFLWPNYRLEDLTCVNRYWYHTNNGSRFSLLRICPQVKIR